MQDIITAVLTYLSELVPCFLLLPGLWFVFGIFFSFLDLIEVVSFCSF